MTLRRPLSIALTAAALALAACGDDDDGGGFVYSDDGRLQVMTRNLYLGADLFPLLTVTPDEFVAVATSVLEAVDGPNNFSARAGALADEIAAARPDLVGLQEVSLWRVQQPSDGVAGNAATVRHDFLATLQNELSARGLPYVVAEEIDLFDFEVPVPITTTTIVDVRYTDRQVILAIQGLPTSAPAGGGSGVFTALFEPIVLGTAVPIPRGWTRVNATVGGQQIAFYNTHLEAFSPTDNALQGSELHAILDADPLSTVTQVVVGDLNAQPGEGGYDNVVGAEFQDLWVELNPGDPGLTCCFDPDLTSSDATLESRIDHILWRGALTPISADRVGEEPADRTGNPPRWPSDHAGVVGTLDPT
jgi:endonuclease/exonuclease/phosphatase family metal-dependent hydrolase